MRQVIQVSGKRLVQGRAIRLSSTLVCIFLLSKDFRVKCKLQAKPSTKYTAVTHPDKPPSVSPATQEILDRAGKYILPLYARHPFVVSHGKGAYVWDTEGREYLDFSAGIAVNALGHADEGVAQVRLIFFFLLLLFYGGM
jgi:Aminotransferase class-III